MGANSQRKCYGLPVEHLELLIPHQANQRIIEASVQRLGLPAERVFSNLALYGNTSAASLPIALCDAIEAGLVQTGDHLALVGFGAGLTWGAAVIEWGQALPTPPVTRRIRALLWLRHLRARLRSLLLRLRRALGALMQRVSPW